MTELPMSSCNAALDFAHYLETKTGSEAARYRNDWASVALDLAGIRQRLAEIKCQHEPLASLLDAKMSERDRLYAAAFYVVVGRPYVDALQEKNDE